jgi:NitT/TauT family transport system permease protein
VTVDASAERRRRDCTVRELSSQRSARDSGRQMDARSLPFGRLNVAGWLFVAFATVLVEVGVRLFDLEDSIPAPSATFAALGRELADGDLTRELGSTLEAYVEGLGVAIAVGVALGVVIGSSRILLSAASVVIEFLRPIPAVALIPLAILAFGLGVPMRRWVIAYATLWPILVNTLYGARGVDRMLHDVARIAGVGRLGRLVRVTLPGALPSVATGIRVSASIGLLVGVTAELYSGTDGIGSYMLRQQQGYQLPELYAAVLLVGVLGFAINLALRAAERRTVFWVGEQRLVAR